MARLKPIKPDEGLTPEMFFDLVPSMFEPDPSHGTVTAICSVCRRRMRPLPLARCNEPTTKLRVRMWVLRRWLELPWGGGTYCPRHLPQFTFWSLSFDLSQKAVRKAEEVPF
jgi:hypothetical protein